MKKDFRMRWASRELKSLSVENEEQQSWKQVGRRCGQHFTLERIAVEFGYVANPTKAMTAATKHCMRAIELGGDWVRYEEMSDEFFFFLYQSQYSEEMENKWTMRQRHFDTVQNPKVT